MPPVLTGLAQHNLEQGAASMRAARLAGVPIALGSDVSLATGLEIQRMVHHGLTAGRGPGRRDQDRGRGAGPG